MQMLIVTVSLKLWRVRAYIMSAPALIKFWRVEKVRGNKRRRQRLMRVLLCCTLCIANVIPTGMTAWASEALPQNTVTDGGEEDKAETGKDSFDLSQEDAGQATVGLEEENSNEENSGLNEENEHLSQPMDPDDSLGEGEDNAEEPGQDTESGQPGDVETEEDGAEPEEEETGEAPGEFTEEDVSGNDIAEESGEAGLKSTLAVAKDVIASGSYTENGSNTTWVIDGNGKLTVEGEGEFGDSFTSEFEGRETPWHNYAKSIKTAEVNVKKMENAESMFRNCSELTEINLSGFDTSNVTNMRAMFYGCYKLENLDLSGFNTSKVTNMRDMFSNCYSLTRLDLSRFDTSSVTNMRDMFVWCKGLRSLDLSGFNTSNVTSMEDMFGNCHDLVSLNLNGFDTSNVTNMTDMFITCWNLESLDLSGFDTSSVTNMYGMFGNCYNLVSLDITGFDTSNVNRMGYMFAYCKRLTNLDVSGFDTSKVTDMAQMFYRCENLVNLNVGSFDTTKVTEMDWMFKGCGSLKSLDISNYDVCNVKNMNDFLLDSDALEIIYTPKNLALSVPLSGEASDIWYQSDGTAIAELPQNLGYSIVITKNKRPDISEPYITAVKKKTAYICGDTVNADDITIMYFDDRGAITKVTEGVTTNAEEINKTMSTPGKKILTVTYRDPNSSSGKVLTAEIELTVMLGLKDDNVTITLPEASLVYNGSEQTPVPSVVVKNAGSTGQLLVEGTDYKVSYENNINAGTQASVIITGMGIYSGKVQKNFSIAKAKVIVRAKDVIIGVDDPVPEVFDYEAEGLVNGDEVTGVSFVFADSNGTVVNKEQISTQAPGRYDIIPKDAVVGANYEIDSQNGYVKGTLYIEEERVTYKVTFNLAGHGSNFVWTGIKSGRLIDKPKDLIENGTVAEGYLFTGWYKDRACTKAWNFDVDTVQEDITLYACWVAQASQGGICIQEIAGQTYTGSAIKPAVIVYAADGSTLLKSGKDYTVKYYNNIEADKPEESGRGGTNKEGIEGENGFTKDLAYVVITGKGNHTGTVYSNFHINRASIADKESGAAAGFTLKYTDQLVVNTKKEQKPFTSLKYKKTMAAGKDYMVTLRATDAYDAAGQPVAGTGDEAWSVTGGEQDKWIPAIPKGYRGIFLMTVTGIGNYAGEIQRIVYVAEKEKLLKNVVVTLGKNQKDIPYDGGREVTLVSGYYDATSKKYYRVSTDGSISGTPEKDASGIFTVKSGKIYLIYGKDYTVTYTDNKAVGTAVMTVTGLGDYKGSKSVTFKIKGTAFGAKNVTVTGIPDKKDIFYTGKAQTWSKEAKLTLEGKDAAGNAISKVLRYGTDYTISYKNNIEKGTATMTFMAKPESGYSGKFDKTFKIGAVQMADPAFVKAEAVNGTGHEQDSLTSGKDEKGDLVYSLNGTVPYTREGAKPAQRIRLSLLDGKGNPTGVVLREGTDYTVSYANNTTLAPAGSANKLPTMTFKGKGNYAGSLKVTFAISEAAMEEGADNLDATAVAMAFDDRKADGYQYAPKITVKDGKKALGKADYEVEYINCSQIAVKTYLDKLAALGMQSDSGAGQAGEGTSETGAPGNTGENNSTAWNAVQAIAPRAVIKAAQGSGYVTAVGKGITVYLDIYETKLTGSNLYVVVSEDTAQTTYKGQGQKVTPEVAVYYGEEQAVKAAKRDKVTEEAKLTAPGGGYHLTKLTRKMNAAGDYTLNYGTNETAGKNKGSVTVTGTGVYGGSVTVRFDILGRNVYQTP